ncbi:MAG: hypothetical protein GF392_03370, partial [Candidatus Omnitrophica bacterium]|nr:hypothetical protein [Candidatus Omnitrophota bacterium]
IEAGDIEAARDLLQKAGDLPVYFDNGVPVRNRMERELEALRESIEEAENRKADRTKKEDVSAGPRDLRNLLDRVDGLLGVGNLQEAREIASRAVRKIADLEEGEEKSAFGERLDDILNRISEAENARELERIQAEKAREKAKADKKLTGELEREISDIRTLMENGEMDKASERLAALQHRTGGLERDMPGIEETLGRLKELSEDLLRAKVRSDAEEGDAEDQLEPSISGPRLKPVQGPAQQPGTGSGTDNEKREREREERARRKKETANEAQNILTGIRELIRQESRKDTDPEDLEHSINALRNRLNDSSINADSLHNIHLRENGEQKPLWEILQEELQKLETLRRSARERREAREDESRRRERERKEAYRQEEEQAIPELEGELNTEDRIRSWLSGRTDDKGGPAEWSPARPGSEAEAIYEWLHKWYEQVTASEEILLDGARGLELLIMEKTDQFMKKINALRAKARKVQGAESAAIKSEADQLEAYFDVFLNGSATENGIKTVYRKRAAERINEYIIKWAETAATSDFKSKSVNQAQHFLRQKRKDLDSMLSRWDITEEKLPEESQAIEQAFGLLGYQVNVTASQRHRAKLQDAQKVVALEARREKEKQRKKRETHVSITAASPDMSEVTPELIDRLDRGETMEDIADDAMAVVEQVITGVWIEQLQEMEEGLALYLSDTLDERTAMFMVGEVELTVNDMKDRRDSGELTGDKARDLAKRSENRLAGALSGLPDADADAFDRALSRAKRVLNKAVSAYTFERISEQQKQTVKKAIISEVKDPTGDIKGKIGVLPTSGGKTMALYTAAYIMALDSLTEKGLKEQRGVVVTALEDSKAREDAEDAAWVLSRLGIQTGYIGSDAFGEPAGYLFDAREQRYIKVPDARVYGEADVVYGTLDKIVHRSQREELSLEDEDRVFSSRRWRIRMDEADVPLIYDLANPFIISIPKTDPRTLRRINELVVEEILNDREFYSVDREGRRVRLNSMGEEKLLMALKENAPDPEALDRRFDELKAGAESLLEAHILQRFNEHYLEYTIKNRPAIIPWDEGTRRPEFGRLPQRTIDAIEAKEDLIVRPQDDSELIAQISALVYDPDKPAASGIMNNPSLYIQRPRDRYIRMNKSGEKELKKQLEDKLGIERKE